MGIGQGDEVIVPDLTFISPVNALLYNGAKPILVDVNKEDWCIDPEKIEASITPHTKAIIVVHLYGNSANMDRITEIVKKHNLLLIEDVAESLGTTYKGKKLGTFGDASCFSFYGNKTMTTGEGGFVIAKKKEVYDKMLTLRDHGMRPERRYWHEFIGYNYRMTNMQAALGLAQLRRIDNFIEKKRQIAKLYREMLYDLVETHPDGKDYSGTYWLYSIILKNQNERDGLIMHLAANGIETRPFFYPVHIMPPYISYAKGEYNISRDLSQRGMNLPSSTKLKDDDVEHISEEIRRYISKRN